MANDFPPKAGERKEFPTPEDGEYHAVISGVWPVGYQLTEYNNVKKYKKQVCVEFEIEYEGQRLRVYDTNNEPYEWPNNKATICQLAETVLGLQGCAELRAWEPLVGKDLRILLRRNQRGTRAYVKRYGAAKREDEPMAPTSPFDIHEPRGLAKWLKEQAVSHEDATEQNEKFRLESEAKKKAEEEAKSFSAPTPGADDTPPQAADVAARTGGEHLDANGDEIPF